MGVIDDIKLQKRELKKLVKLQFGYLDEAIKGRDKILINKTEEGYAVGNGYSILLLNEEELVLDPQMPTRFEGDKRFWVTEHRSGFVESILKSEVTPAFLGAFIKADPNSKVALAHTVSIRDLLSPDTLGEYKLLEEVGIDCKLLKKFDGLYKTIGYTNHGIFILFKDYERKEPVAVITGVRLPKRD